jgi:ATP-dependent RNA helicase SUPV3L1/SUV3
VAPVVAAETAEGAGAPEHRRPPRHRRPQRADGERSDRNEGPRREQRQGREQERRGRERDDDRGRHGRRDRERPEAALRDKYIKGRGERRGDKAPDPDSPFAKLAALKAQLEAGAKDG